MSLYLIVALAAAALSPAPAAGAAPAHVHVPGTTAGDGPARDALAEVQRFSGGALKCGDVRAVKASAKRSGWVPSDPNFRLAPAGARYERWDVNLCGRPDSFLVAFWTEAKGGPQFVVGHPFPADPAPAGKSAPPGRRRR